MTSKAFVLTSTPKKFNGEAGADVAFSCENIAHGTGWVSAQFDLGAGAREFEFDWSCEVVWQGTPTQFSSMQLYIATAPDDDATQIDGDVGAVDAALSDVDQRRNLEHIGDVVVEEPNTTKMVGSGSFICKKRYLTIVAWNNGGTTTNATDSNFVFKLTPSSVQGQAT